MPRKEKPTAENNWLLTDEQLDAVVHHYVELKKSQQQTAFATDVSVHVIADILKHKKLTRSPWDRARHPWSREVGAAVAKRENRTAMDE